MAKNYYEELGLTRDASPEQIKKAYRKLARLYHPDISKEANAEEKMQAINVAYDTLSHADKKKEYDFALDHPHFNSNSANANDFNAQGFGSNDYQNFDQNANFSGFEDLFGRFGAGFGGGFSRGRSSEHYPIRGEDQHASLEVPLQVAFEGSQQTITLQIPTYNAYGQAEVQRKTLEIKIPKGMKDGQQLRLSKQGQSGINGGDAGDLYIEIKYKTSADIRVEQADIFYNIQISPWEAALGQEIEVKTPSGTIKVHIPPNTIYGKQLRIKDKGIPAKTPGHLYLILNIVYPKAETPEQVQAYEHFAHAFPHFNPREHGGQS